MLTLLEFFAVFEMLQSYHVRTNVKGTMKKGEMFKTDLLLKYKT